MPCYHMSMLCPGPPFPPLRAPRAVTRLTVYRPPQVLLQGVLVFGRSCGFQLPKWSKNQNYQILIINFQMLDQLWIPYALVYRLVCLRCPGDYFMDNFGGVQNLHFWHFSRNPRTNQLQMGPTLLDAARLNASLTIYFTENTAIRMIKYGNHRISCFVPHTSVRALLYVPPRRKPGWRFTAGYKLSATVH